MPTRYRATVAYDGTAYYGFQRQAGATPTIQSALEKALLETTGQQATVSGAGRTDSGVHARGQVIAFDVDWRHDDEALLRALNARLADDIALQDIRQQAGFHPRFDAVARVYQYDIFQAGRPQPLLRRRAWYVHWALDGARMQEAADLLVGEHDFAAFGKPPQGNNTVRHVYRSAWTSQPLYDGVLWTYRIEANAFLYRMVRRVAAMLVAVGCGRLSVGDFEERFRQASLAEALAIAPPHGLVLEAVRYPAWPPPGDCGN